MWLGKINTQNYYSAHTARHYYHFKKGLAGTIRELQKDKIKSWQREGCSTICSYIFACFVSTNPHKNDVADRGSENHGWTYFEVLSIRVDRNKSSSKSGGRAL